MDIIRCTTSHSHLNWLTEDLATYGIKCRKTLVFTTSTETSASLYEYCMDTLEEKAYVEESVRIENRMCEMFHSHTDSQSRERILNEFSSTQSRIRLLFSTVKIGMGVNLPDVDLVIIFGLPRDSVITLWQEAGRAARQINHGFCLIYATNKSVNQVEDPHLKELVDNKDSLTCHREMILRCFVLKGMKAPTYVHEQCKGDCSAICSCSKCRCCGNCSKRCDCRMSKSVMDQVRAVVYN